jgi:hypothetical protein
VGPQRPAALLDHRVVVAFHGCDQATADRVLVTGEPMKPSSNRWDWLGEGIYFWEQDPERAWQFAEEQRERGKIANPSVIGAFIHLGRCFDLTTSVATSALAAAHAALLVRLAGVGAPVPVNRGGSGGGGDLLLRDLDCAVLNFHLREFDKARGLDGPYYQTVRGVFVEGVPAFPGGSIFTKTHTQVAIRDPAVIVGYFRPSRYSGTGA